MSVAVDSPHQPLISDGKTTSPAAHWRRRRNAVPMPADEKARQGSVSNLAFQILGKDAAIAFLNAEHEGLGGRPLALATQSPEGAALVKAELERIGLSAASSPHLD